MKYEVVRFCVQAQAHPLGGKILDFGPSESVSDGVLSKNGYAIHNYFYCYLIDYSGGDFSEMPRLSRALIAADAKEALIPVHLRCVLEVTT